MVCDGKSALERSICKGRLAGLGRQPLNSFAKTGYSPIAGANGLPQAALILLHHD